MEQNGSGEDNSVAALLHDWKEDNLDIESLLSNRQDSQNANQSPYQADHRVPTFHGNAGNNPHSSSGANNANTNNTNTGMDNGRTRPNALDLTRTIKYEPLSCQQQVNNATPVSPRHSPYHNAEVSTPYSYGNTSPSTSNSRQTTPTSPYTRALHSPVSPHQVSPMSPHRVVLPPQAVSPHHQQNSCSRASSISPVPPYCSAVFGRYANDALSDESSSFSPYGGSDYGFKRQHSPIDKNSDLYRAKRERNNIAVRRSREKKKQREAENEVRVQELTDENNKLQSRLDVVLKEMKLLKSLYKNIGVALPAEAQQKIERELAKINASS